MNDMLAYCLAALIGGAIVATSHVVKNLIARRRAQQKDAAQHAAEQSALDTPEERPTVDMTCPDCDETVPCHYHLHFTPLGIVAHVETEDMALHELVCDGSK